MDLKEYNQLQIDEMEKHKWIESEKAGYDVGPAAHIDWVKKYAAQFRETHPINEESQSADDKLTTEEKMKADNGVSTDIS